MKASIVITSHNYQDYVSTAIESALTQSWPHKEIIVVDDGSSDASPSIIRTYGDKITPVFKDCGGQASAFNVGAGMASGDFIIFLDSDDFFVGDVVAEAASRFHNSSVSKVHWNLWIADTSGRTGNRLIRDSLSDGDLRDAVLQSGANAYAWPPTSGNAWSRKFIDRVLPIPENDFTTCPDLYLSTLAPLYGEVVSLAKPHGAWRYHGKNASHSKSFDDEMAVGIEREKCCISAVQRHCKVIGLNFSPEIATENLMYHSMRKNLHYILRQVPRDTAYILADLDQWKMPTEYQNRFRYHFLDCNGEYWGLPSDDAHAIHELKRLRVMGAGAIVFVWPHLWILDHYIGLTCYLEAEHQLIYRSNRCVIYSLFTESEESDRQPVDHPD